MSNTKIITSIWNQKRGRLAHKLKNLDQFAGKLVHTAVWDTTLLRCHPRAPLHPYSVPRRANLGSAETSPEIGPKSAPEDV
ncbi:uncharacterized protein N7525_010836 [Penicillium rubens]|uniref:uncharacterized protein n=1 Tax=Penicillium rubens TaxID=1108849 RepID=UPI002A5997FE|nr:uncharacterized protein N7525_010836 [Penicillium rubens]KAJ5821552.1 hypothetical protein N7525_010836 [Penicillium rubens]KAJ5859204.1 hypothetical protein N7534_004481 [Penicillium rubens]